MRTPGLISVIVPVYNVEKYLQDCVDSILNQTYRSLEIILIDDGSTDRSAELCDVYALRDSRVKTIHKINGGQSEARNLGLDISHGEYISFVDSDDIIHPRFLEIMKDNIGGRNIVICKVDSFHDGNLPVIKEDEKEIVTAVIGSEKLMTHLIMDTDLIVPWNKFYKWSVWANLRFPVGMLHEDEYIAHEILAQSQEIVVLNMQLYYYRIRNGSTMSLASQNHLRLNKIEAFSHRRDFFIEKNGCFKKDIILLNNEILNSCLFFFVKRTNPIWEKMTLKVILFENTLPIPKRAVLLIKKTIYPVYSIVYQLYISFRKM